MRFHAGTLVYVVCLFWLVTGCASPDPQGQEATKQEVALVDSGAGAEAPELSQDAGEPSSGSPENKEELGPDNAQAEQDTTPPEPQVESTPESPTEGGPNTDAQKQFLDVVAKALCKAIYQNCCNSNEALNPQVGQMFGGSYEVCVRFFQSNQVQQPDFARVRFDPKRAEECRKKLDQEKCAISNEVLTLCGAAMEGIQGEGEDCSIDTECKPGLYCTSSGCAKRKKVGEACDIQNNNCAPGSTCLENKNVCVPEKKQGEACSKDNKCARPLMCSNATCNPPPRTFYCLPK